MGSHWRGLLAPINKPTGDGRRIAPGGFTSRPLPLPLKWQRADSNGHDEAVVVGVIDQMNINEELGEVWGEGELFDDVNPAITPQLAEDAATARTLIERKVVGPSVDPGSAQATAVMQGMDRAPTMAEIQQFCDRHDGNMPPTEMLFTSYEIAGATLVPIPAFSEARPLELFTPGLTASKVRTSGWADLPIAPRERPWDADAAKARLATSCGLDGDSPDWDCYASGFLYEHTDRDPQTRGAYSFPIVDIVDGQRHLVPAAVYAAANILSGGRGGTDIPADKQKAMRGVVATLYKRLAAEFDDDTIRAPWAGKMTALVAAARLPMPDGSLFLDPQLDAITPMTSEPMANGWTRVFGHISTHDVCHVAMRGGCTTAPFSDQEYQTFHRYHRTQGGIELPLSVGRLTVGHGQLSSTCRCCPGNDDHACNNIGLGATIAHHDRMRVLAYGRCGEDERNNAIWFSGVLEPEADERDLQVFNRRKVSGDWRETAGNMELVEILALSRREPGFPLPRMSMENGRQRSLTAASPIGAIVERENRVTNIELGDAFGRIGRRLEEAIGHAVVDTLDGFAFNPNQKRGPNGRWISMGGKGSAGGGPDLPGRKPGAGRKSEGGGAGAGGRDSGGAAGRASSDRRNRSMLDLGRQLTGTGGDFDEADAELDDVLTQLDDAIASGNATKADSLADEAADLMRDDWRARGRIPGKDLEAKPDRGTPEQRRRARQGAFNESVLEDAREALGASDDEGGGDEALQPLSRAHDEAVAAGNRADRASDALARMVDDILGTEGLNPRPPSGGDREARSSWNQAQIEAALEASQDLGDDDDNMLEVNELIQRAQAAQRAEDAAIDRLRDQVVDWVGGDMPQRPSNITAAAQANTGAMIALRMSEQDANRLAVTGGEPQDQLHLTLAYLGDADQIPPEIRKKIEAEGRKLASTFSGPIEGDGFAIDVFNPGTANDRDTAIVMGVGGRSMADVHAATMAALGGIGGLSMPEQHRPYVPHVTLQYTDDLNRVKSMADRVGPVKFDRLRLAFGGEVTDIPIGAVAKGDGGAREKRRGAMYAAEMAQRAQRATLALRATLAASQLGRYETPMR